MPYPQKEKKIREEKTPCMYSGTQRHFYLSQMNNFFTPCLITAQISCDNCTVFRKENETEATCNFCTNSSKVFLGLDCVKKFIKYLLNLEIQYTEKVSNIYIIGQNCAKFDTHFVYNYCLTHTELLRNPPLVRGNKILLLQVSIKLKFLDSYLFLPLPLRKFAKTFNLPKTKAWFPHDWFSKVIFFQNYVKFLPFSAVNDCRMTMQDYESMKAEVCDANDMFYVQRLLIRYCMQDTRVLRLGFDYYLKLMNSKFGVHPLHGSITYSSLTFKIWNMKYMPENVYIHDTASVLSQVSMLQYEWLHLIKRQIDTKTYQLITGRDPSGEVNIWCGPRRLKIDGCLIERATQKLVTAYEFLGCYWHSHYIKGRPCKLNNSGDVQTYLNTMQRLQTIKKFHKLHYKWECVYREECKRDSRIKAISDEFKEFNNFGFYQARRLMVGGRVEVFHRFEKVSKSKGECIKFYDVTSLYPWVQKTNLFPIGRLYNLIDDEAPSVDEFIQMMKDNPNSGAALIAIQAPEQLLHPVLGCKIKGKLYFTLCPKCAEFDLFPCTHDEDEHMIVGEFTYPEFN